MKIFQGVTELQEAVGTHLGYSDWFDVTQGDVDLFAAVTRDHQWIHVDPHRAGSGPFGTTVAHGYLTLSLVAMFVQQVYRVDGVTMAINYGANRIRFPAPVPVGSRLRGGVELTDVGEAAGGLLAHTRVVVERDGGDKPVCVADTLSMFTP